MRRARRHACPGTAPALLAVLLVCLAAPPVRADEDAGLRSVFALGAGNRALALGGAYGAVAAGPAGPTWNPAGLALQQRTALTVTHTSLFGMGFGEQFLGLAWPDWRRGTFGLTIRRFGTGGIERRDDRNVLLDGNLTDRELEFGLGYGRSLRPGLHAGVLLKLQTQSLADRNAGGVGLDAGVIASPLRLRDPDRSGGDAWTVGLTVRNLLEPSLRLDLDSVSDPRAWRLGTAYRRAITTDVVALAAVDLEQTRGMDRRAHAGVEVAYRRLAALRLGTLHGNLTAGFGVTWRDYRVDVAFEDNPLGSITRFGVTLQHGPDVTVQRETALRRREAARRRELEAALRQRQRRQLAELLAQVQTALAAGDLAGAASELAMAQVLAPDEPRVRQARIELLRRQAADQEAGGDAAAAAVTYRRLLAVVPDDSLARHRLALLQEQSDRRARRDAALRRLLDQALDAFARDDLPTARRQLQALLARQPDDSLAGSLLRRVEEAVRNRQADLVEQARIRARAGDPAGAQRLLDQADRLQPGTAAVTAARREVAHRRRALAAARRATPSAAAAAERNSSPTDRTVTPPRLTPQQRREVERQYQQGLEAAAAGNSDLALRHWELAWSLDPGYADLRQRLLNEYLTRGMERFAAGRLEEAIGVWERAVQVDPGDRRARTYLERARSQLAKIRSLTE